MNKVLLIEDNPDVRGLLKEALEAAGYDVFAVSDGSAGMKALRRVAVDVVVTDLFMPGMEGIETIAELRRHHPSARIIAISGGSRLRRAGADPYLAVAREIGADAVLKKPFDPGELVAAVRQVLG